jgi:hypothetical protein
MQSIPGGAPQRRNEPRVSYKERAVPSVSILVRNMNRMQKIDVIVLQHVSQPVADLLTAEEHHMGYTGICASIKQQLFSKQRKI